MKPNGPCEFSVDFKPSEPLGLLAACAADSEPFTLTCPDGGKMEWVGTMKPLANGRARLLADPGTIVVTPGPWRKRFAYWFKCRWWWLRGWWKTGVEAE